ncbi:MAG: 30S ribosomal protein S4 [Elusimicrobiota bacterium]
MCAVYRGPVCKLCRREGKKIFLKGSRCKTAKCSFEKKEYPPGQHAGSARFSRPSGYGIQLREKQKVRRSVQMTEKQFKRFFSIAEKTPGPTGANLLILLESRLDNVIRRMGFSLSINEARQMINHCHVKVNGRVCNIASYVVSPGDRIAFKEKSVNLEAVKASVEENEGMPSPEWLKTDTAKRSGEVIRLPERDEITLCSGDISENLIVELYSK